MPAKSLYTCTNCTTSPLTPAHVSHCQGKKSLLPNTSRSSTHCKIICLPPSIAAAFLHPPQSAYMPCIRNAATGIGHQRLLLLFRTRGRSRLDFLTRCPCLLLAHAARRAVRDAAQHPCPPEISQVSHNIVEVELVSDHGLIDVVVLLLCAGECRAAREQALGRGPLQRLLYISAGAPERRPEALA